MAKRSTKKTETALVLRTCAADERFWKKVDKSAGDLGCWLWTAYRDKNGYGSFQLSEGRPIWAHRFVVERSLGRDLFSTEIVMHSCDNPPCCNPAHLSIGTRADNRRDCVLKNRHATGETHGKAKLTVSQVIKIKTSLSLGASPTAIAREYGVWKWTIQQIKNGTTWRNVHA